MKKRISLIALAVAFVILAGVAIVIQPRPLAPSPIWANHQADLVNGKTIFDAGNCSGCHMTPGQSDRQLLGGGLELESPYGTFTVPNISPDPEDGIGRWTGPQFASALKRGVGRDGEHLYPAFPYASYARLTDGDVADLYAYIATLPRVSGATGSTDLAFPYNMRTLLGFWKLLHFDDAPLETDETRSAEWNRGHYLVEAAAHCAECHTPRGSTGGLDTERLYAGAPSLEAGGKFASNITSSDDGIGDWTDEDIAILLETGMDPCFNEPSGMKAVLDSTRELSLDDINAMSVYLGSIPAKPGNGEHKAC